MPDPILVVQLIVNGLVIGAIYALLAAGLSLIFGVLDVVNLAHGALYMLGAYAAFFLVPLGGYWVAALLSGIVLAFFGYILYELLFSRLPAAGGIPRSILLTIGIAMILENGAIAIWSASPRVVETNYAQSLVTIGFIQLPLLRVFAVLIATLALAGLFLLLQKTIVGKAMRAISQNREAALMVGLRPRRVARMAIMLGLGLAGLAGATLAPIYTVHPLMGLTIVFKTFAIVVIGGMGSIPGAVIISLLVGVVESVVGGLATTVIQDLAVFVLMIAVLFFRPQGLFAKRVRI